MIPSYSSIQTLGHRYLANLFNGPVVIQEKIDGSQFSFGMLNGKLCCRSKGQELHVDAPEKMFNHAVATAKRCFDAGILPEGYVFRCEYLSKPKHNTLAYSRIPTGNLVLFDVCIGGENYSTAEALKSWAGILGIEPVPVFFEGILNSTDYIQSLLGRESVLGGCKIEGVVVKNYNQFGPDNKILIGKFVSPEFKEVHRHEWKKTNPGPADVVQGIIANYKTSPRWCKAIQHLRERGELVNAPEDIGKLIREVQADVKNEEGAAIAQRLYEHFWPQISRGIVGGLAEWYKQRLADAVADTEFEKIADEVLIPDGKFCDPSN